VLKPTSTLTDPDRVRAPWELSGCTISFVSLVLTTCAAFSASLAEHVLASTMVYRARESCRLEVK
jgi:hypothetical protein